MVIATFCLGRYKTGRPPARLATSRRYRSILEQRDAAHLATTVDRLAGNGVVTARNTTVDILRARGFVGSHQQGRCGTGDSYPDLATLWKGQARVRLIWTCDGSSGLVTAMDLW